MLYVQTLTEMLKCIFKFFILLMYDADKGKMLVT